MTVADQKSLLSTIKMLQGSIESTKNQLKSSLAAIPFSRVPVRPVSRPVPSVAPAVLAVTTETTAVTAVKDPTEVPSWADLDNFCLLTHNSD